MTEWRDILVLAEPLGGAPHPASLEVLGKARELADRLGARVAAAWPGPEDAGAALAHRGADEVVVLAGEPMPRPLRTGLEGLVRERRPEMVLLAATPLGQELAGRLAAALGVGALGNCSGLDLDEGARLLVGRRATHQGALVETLTSRAKPQVATLRPGAVRAPWPDDTRTARVTRAALPPGSVPHTKLLGREPAGGPRDWRGAERLVVGGALLAEQDLDALRAVAEKLGAAWAVTRLAAKVGLAPEERALRPWDRFPAPRLCLAAGIEDPYEFAMSLPRPRQLVLLGEGPLERMATQVVAGPPGAALRALAQELA
jgi:electron transfer flavoprotein alpha subunit